MYPRSVGSHETLPFALPRVRAGLVLLLLCGLGAVIIAYGMARFPRHIGRPCVACYLGAFGPPLEPYGQPFRQPGDRATDAKPPMAVPASIVVPRASGLTGGPLWIAPDNRLAPFRFDTDRAGAGRFDPGTVGLPGPEAASEAPAWNAGPVWSFPQYGAHTGAIMTMDARPANQRDSDFGRDALDPGTSWTGGLMPHWRVAVQKDLERHFLQIGAGIVSGVSEQPPNRIAGDPPSEDTPLIYEARPLGAGFTLLGIDGFRSLDTVRAGAPYRFAATVTPPIQSVHIAGPADAIQYFWPDVAPNSAGVVAGFAYTPWDRPASPLRSLNLRFAAQYAVNKEFSGVVRGAGGSNTLVLSLWGALHF